MAKERRHKKCPDCKQSYTESREVDSLGNKFGWDRVKQCPHCGRQLHRSDSGKRDQAPDQAKLSFSTSAAPE